MGKKLTWNSRCQKCGKLKESTRQRTFEGKSFIGPCGDSFCYASCEMESCRPISGVICDGCEKELAKEKK
jgi:hypothetical protein